MENVKIDVTANGGELIIREGEAAPVEVSKQFVFVGDIDSPVKYFRDRSPRNLVPCEKSHVVVNRRKMTIELVQDENYSKQTIITGVLKDNEDLTAFGIWKQIWRRDGLQKFLRKNRRFFEDKEQFDKIGKSLASFVYERNVSGEESDDKKGNTKKLREQTLKQNVDLEFTLSIPIFEGFGPKTFRVEIVPDVTDAEVKFFLESVELLELREKEFESIIAKQLALFSNNILIMYQ